MQLEVSKSAPSTDRRWPPDALVAYLPKFDEYGLVVHDGGSSTVQIHFCPWCGTRLPESRRDQWFEELQKKGIDPLSGHVPPEFQSDAWYRLELKQLAQQARRERDAAPEGSRDRLLNEGRLLAFHRVVSLMQQQAEGLGIALSGLRLEDIAPDRDLT